jgi:Tol biopolymer transport system component
METGLPSLRVGPGKNRIATRVLGESKTTLLAGTEEASDPFFSPDGLWIGFAAQGKLKKISVQGDAPVTLCDAPIARGASWGDDGDIIASLNTPGGIFHISANGGTPQPLTNPAEKGEVTHRWPQALPGSRAIVFTSHTAGVDFDNANISVLPSKSSEWKVIQRSAYFGRYLATGHLAYVHQSKLFAAPFDAARQEIVGTPTLLLDDLAASPLTGGGQFDFSLNGTMIYLAGKPQSQNYPVVWLDSNGKRPLLGIPGFYFTPRLSPDGKRLALSVGSESNDIWIYE